MNPKVKKIFEKTISTHYSEAEVDAEFLGSFLDCFLKELAKDTFSNPFICMEVGDKDSVGLPEKIGVCPQYGSDGFAIYTKTTEYSAPGY